MNESVALPFDDSRRLTGSNLFFDSTGAVLETVGVAVEDVVLSGWRERVARAQVALGWLSRPAIEGFFRSDPDPDQEALNRRAAGAESTEARSTSRSADRTRSIAARRHATGTSLALAAPFDQLFTATEINEWAFCAALAEHDPVRWSGLEVALIEAAKQAAARAAESASPASRTTLPVAFAAALPVLNERAALARFATLSKLEAAPRLRSLVTAADAHRLLHVLDDDHLTLGSGVGGRTWPVDALPDADDVSWDTLRNVPSAIVTGSNGKTTTVRLLAACARAQGWLDGYNCSDGVFVAGEQIESGDYSGPLGTRTVLRDTRVEAAILETARGGILRRGLAADCAHVAVITNVSADHFGEYGIHDLPGLADVKLVVASTVGDSGLLVLNADDPLLRTRAEQLDCRIGWFSRDYDSVTLRGHRASGGSTSGVRDGHLITSHSRDARNLEEFDLGAVADMPLTVDGSADYNISNVAGAALAALELGIVPTTIASVLAQFGANPSDNPGRLMRYSYRGAQVLIDYAHNPEGLSGLMNVAAKVQRTGRLALLLGQAGNRETSDIERLAATAASFRPDFVVVKETEAYLRGRSPGEVPAILRAALLKAGLPESALEMCLSERAAVQRVLEWSREGDVLVLPVHDRAVRAEVVAMIA